MSKFPSRSVVRVRPLALEKEFSNNNPVHPNSQPIRILQGTLNKVVVATKVLKLAFFDHRLVDITRLRMLTSWRVEDAATPLTNRLVSMFRTSCQIADSLALLFEGITFQDARVVASRIVNLDFFFRRSPLTCSSANRCFRRGDSRSGRPSPFLLPRTSFVLRMRAKRQYLSRYWS